MFPFGRPGCCRALKVERNECPAVSGRCRELQPIAGRFQSQASSNSKHFTKCSAKQSVWFVRVKWTSSEPGIPGKHSSRPPSDPSRSEQSRSWYHEPAYIGNSRISATRSGDSGPWTTRGTRNSPATGLWWTHSGAAGSQISFGSFHHASS